MGTRLHVGTSGYSYREWKGSFYPDDLPVKGMLGYYGDRFGTVEINGSFYKLPSAATVEAWTKDVPASFQFALKAPQRITHFQRLKDAERQLAEFLAVAAVLKGRQGPLLFQLPPNMKKDTPRLRDFLPLLPGGSRAAFEFRHATWFDDDVFSLLEEMARPFVSPTPMTSWKFPSRRQRPSVTSVCGVRNTAHPR